MIKAVWALFKDILEFVFENSLHATLGLVYTVFIFGLVFLFVRSIVYVKEHTHLSFYDLSVRVVVGFVIGAILIEVFIYLAGLGKEWGGEKLWNWINKRRR